MAQDHDYNRGGMIAFIFSMTFVFCFFVYLMVIHPGVDLGENVVDPNAPVEGAPVEKQVDVAAIKEPWVDNADMVAHGAKLFKANCMMCHGEKGLGDGAAGAALNPKPRNLVEGKWKLGGDSVALYKTLTSGIAGTSMAAYGHMTPADRWGLVQFIKSITQNKVADDAAKVAEFAKTAK